LAVCALCGTLIGDLDGVYDPRDYNDRLVLGLQGTMSEAELHVLKQRLLAGQQAKAQRGELRLRVPMGDVRRPSGEVVKEPDAQAQAVIALIFEQFARLGTLGGVLRSLVRQGIPLPCRVATGLNKGTWSGVGPINRPSRICCIIRCMRGRMSMAGVPRRRGGNTRAGQRPAGVWPPRPSGRCS
jgi:hypothetical protein